jgi:hypothetical protein
MKKIILSLFFIGAMMFVSNAQVIYSENFDALTAGANQYAALQLGGSWTTWNGKPGTDEDGIVSSAQSFSPSNSVYISNASQDLIYNFNDLTTGRYKIGFKIFVESGRLGYFNLLLDHAGNDSKWATQSFMKDGKFTTDAGGIDIPEKTYNVAAWNDIVYFIDLDDDFATLTLNGEEVVSWKFSGGSHGLENTKKLDAIDFFGWDDDGNGGAGFFIDDFFFESVTAPEAPTSLIATVLDEFNVKLDWTAPSLTPKNYLLSRNDVFLMLENSLVTTTDSSVYPDEYVYALRAYYDGAGYSLPATVNVNIPGGIERDFVLYEIATSTNCPICPSTAKGAKELRTNNKKATIVSYHNDLKGNEPYVNVASQERARTYLDLFGSEAGLPTTFMDGYYYIVGGSANQSLYPNYEHAYNKLIVRKAIHDIDLNVTKTGEDAYHVVATVKQTSRYYPSGLVFRLALTEYNISFNWQGQTKLDWVCRDMYPNATGTFLNFGADSTQTMEFDFSTAGYVANNCELTAWVQYGDFFEVTQSTYIDLSTIIGIEESAINNISVYPNPANDVITIATNEKANYEIINVAGQVVKAGTIENNLENVNVSNLQNGSYFVRVIGKDVFVKQIVIN